MGKRETVQVAFRLPRSLLMMLDARVDEMTVANRGMVVTRTDVLRMILTQALSAEDMGTGRKR